MDQPKSIFRDNARRYSDLLGWLVFPQAAGSKVPMRGTNGIKDASSDRAQIAAWSKLYPHANIGLLCGSQSGVIVIDIDDRSGGHQTIAKLAQAGKMLADTVEAASPGNGRHLFYAYDRRVAVSGSNKLGNGVDVLTNGHAVTLAPSYSADKQKCYRWVRPPRGADFPKLPRWVIDAMKPKPAPKLQPVRQVDFAKLRGYERQAEADLLDAAKRVATLDDGRHVAPFKAGASIGVYVHHNLISASRVETVILDACGRNGALKKYPINDLRKQVHNGIARARGDCLPPLARAHGNRP